MPLPAADRMQVPRLRLKAFLSDFDDPARLLELEAEAGGADPLAAEPCAVLDLRVTAVAAGGDSPFLPEAYASLYEEGSVLGRP